MPRLSAEELRGTISIPTLSRVVARVSRMVNDPSIGIKQVGDAVASDAPIAAPWL